MATLTVENYVKAIYQIGGGSEATTVSTGELARRLEVSPGTVTSMFRTLSDSGLAVYQAYEGVRLTEAGSRLALRVLRRHRMIELFLTRTLGMSWDEVHEEAEHLEHAVSDRLIDRIDEFLQFPDRDPHGDPIPRPDGTFSTVPCQPLDRCAATTQVVLERVVDQSPEFLRFLGQSGLEVGTVALVVENHPSAGAVVIQTDDRQITLGRDAAGKVLVRPR
jgi:DtxR family Mn-dependent transcriptional regulator